MWPERAMACCAFATSTTRCGVRARWPPTFSATSSTMRGENYSMRFVRADASKVTALMEFRDQCMPVFAFYKGGEQVAKVEGADIVKIKNLIFEKAPKPA